jgi:hypothetical protein
MRVNFVCLQEGLMLLYVQITQFSEGHCFYRYFGDEQNVYYLIF